MAKNVKLRAKNAKEKLKKEENKYCQPGFFRFKERGGEHLLTNEVGDFIFLKKPDFKNFINGKLPLKSKLGRQLKDFDFLKHDAPCDRMINKYRNRNDFMFHNGPSLHIVVVTLRCNHRCVYCQTTSARMEEKGKDMDLKTAKKVVDFIFSSPNSNIAIEFQGGEPLVNWPAVKFITEYAREKNKKAKKDLEIRLVSNFSLMDEEKLKFFFDKNVSLCASLDGPDYIHNKNRPLIGGNSYQEVSYWLKRAFEEFYKKEKNQAANTKKGVINYLPGALLTISRFSLKYPKEIIDEYFKWGFDNIYTRPVNSIGFAKGVWEQIGYPADEFVQFYKKSLDYILAMNKRGKLMREATAAIFIGKILSDKSPTMLDMRSPCGAVIGQLLYFYDGSIYSCDEGRMAGSDIFKVGNAHKNNYREIINSPSAKALCVSSCLENTLCDYCVYKPYCGVCPVINYIDYGNIFSPAELSDRCQINKKILDYLFELIKNPVNKKIFELWIDRGKWSKKFKKKYKF